MTRTIVCFGDSNTHGADPSAPRPHCRARCAGHASWSAPWVRATRSSRRASTVAVPSGIRPSRRDATGLTYLYPCLLSHAPVDLVIIMLGTNDLKRIYGHTAAEIAGGAARLVDEAKGTLDRPRWHCRRRCCWCRRCRSGRSPRTARCGASVPRVETSKRAGGHVPDRGRRSWRRLLRRRVGGTGQPGRWCPPRRRCVCQPGSGHGEAGPQTVRRLGAGLFPATCVADRLPKACRLGRLRCRCAARRVRR